MIQPLEMQSLTLALLDGHSASASTLAALPADHAQQYLAFLREHALLGSVGLAVQNQSLQSALPEHLRVELAQHAEFQRAYNQRALQTTIELNDLLRSQGIPVITLKGCYYAKRYWQSLEKRFLWDIDLLVPAEQRWQALGHLQSAGYATMPGYVPRGRLLRSLTHGVTLKTARGPDLDLHHSFRARPGYRIDYSDVWASSEAYKLEDAELQVLSSDHELLFLLLAVAHDIEGGKLKLKLLLDLKLLVLALDAHMDWPAFLARRRAEGLDKLCLHVLGFLVLALDMQAIAPRLNQQLEDASPLEDLADRNKVQRMLYNPRQSPENRRWLAALSPSRAGVYLLWWTLTVPLRYAMGRKI